jgi:hypothetical protein
VAGVRDLARAVRGTGTVTATSTPRRSPAAAMTTTPIPERASESSSIARVERTTVAEP